MWPWKKRVEGNAADEKMEDPPPATRPSLPTVKFNPKHVTDEVRSDIAATLRRQRRLSNTWRDIYSEAVLSVEEGGNLARLARALQTIGWTSADAGDLARHVHSRATAIIGRSRQLDAGFAEAEWRYSGAGCLTYNKDTATQIAIDAAHRAANGKRYLVAEGLAINGRRTWPGMERHCKCVSGAVIKGLS